MNTIVNNAEDILRHHPAPSMELVELHARLHSQWPTLTPSCASLRRTLEKHPGRFLLVEPDLRLWSQGDARTPGTAGETHTNEPPRVLVLSLGSGPTEACRQPADARLRESVRWIARGLDRRSGRSVARLHAMLMSEDAVRPKLRRKAA